MGQQDLYEFLKAHKDKWYTTKEIAEKSNCSLGNITRSAQKLRYREEIYYKKDPLQNHGRGCLVYKYKR